MIFNGLILCAGMGTRLVPITNILPKPLLPINGKAILESNILALQDSQASQIGIVVSPRNKQIFEKFLEKVNLLSAIKIIVQERQLGVVDAITSAKLFKGTPLTVLAGDTTFTSSIIQQLTQPIRQHNASITIGMERRLLSQIKRRSNVVLDSNDSTKVIRVVEKPNIGQIVGKWSGAPIWSFFSSIWEVLEQTPMSARGEYDVAETINLAIKQNNLVRGVEIPHVADLTFPIDLLTANFPYVRDFLADL